MNIESYSAEHRNIPYEDFGIHLKCCTNYCYMGVNNRLPKQKKTRNVEPSVVHQTFLNIDNFPSGCDLDLSYLNQHLFQEPFPNIFQGVLCISNIGSFKFHVRTHFMKMIELAC